MTVLIPRPMLLPLTCRRSVLGFALLSLVAAPVRSGAQALPPHAPTLTSTAVLRPGDIVRISVWRNPELSGEVHVAADGSLRHPLYREVNVAGISAEMATERLRVFLSRFEANPQLVLEPLLRVSVVGEVRLPNLYSLSPETTLAEAIALAGGPTDRGRLDRVTILRGGRATRVDLTGADTTWAYSTVRSGDRIVVGRARDLLRDYVGPVASVAAVLVALANLFRRGS